MGSRNGHAPIYLWYTLTLKGYEGIRRDVEQCMRNAAILKVMLEAAGALPWQATPTQTRVVLGGLCLGLLARTLHCKPPSHTSLAHLLWGV